MLLNSELYGMKVFDTAKALRNDDHAYCVRLAPLMIAVGAFEEKFIACGNNDEKKTGKLSHRVKNIKNKPRVIRLTLILDWYRIQGSFISS